MATIHSVGKHKGIAGQYSITAEVSYPEEGDTDRSRVEFVGSVYGGPVIMVTPMGHQTFVTEPGRFGEFGEEWVRRFFS